MDNAEWEAFFRSEEKHRYTVDPERQDGYFPFRSENAKDHPRKDLKEFFHVYPRTTLPAGLSGATGELYAALSSLAGELLGWIEDHAPARVRDGLSMPLRDMVKESPQTLFRILHYPPADPGSVVVNSGDMLQMASGGCYRSTTHRVVNPAGDDARRPRLSMPLFLHPWPQVRLSATHTAREYLDERLREIGLK